MNYAYYPGCSLHSNAREYDESTRAVCAALGVELQEIEDWNCCGTVVLPTTSYLFSLVAPARNLALAEERKDSVAVACNSCFVSLRRAQNVYQTNPEWRVKMQEALGAIGKEFHGRAEIKHILDIVVNDIGLERIKQRTVHSLGGLRLVPYYGCQIARPRNDFAHPEQPTEMDRLLKALGANVLRYDHKTKCCGGSHMTTQPDVTLELNEELLAEAVERGAEAIVVSCPLCQFNLDAYQERINKKFGTAYRMPIVYFTQLLGIALGLDPKTLGLKRNLVPVKGLLQKYGGEVVANG